MTNINTIRTSTIDGQSRVINYLVSPYSLNLNTTSPGITPVLGALAYGPDAQDLFLGQTTGVTGVYWQAIGAGGIGPGGPTGPAASASWTLTGNAGTSFPTDFLGTLDNQPLYIVTNNTTGTAFKFTQRGALEPQLSGGNLFIGQLAGLNVPNNNGSVIENVGIGQMTLENCTGGSNNIAIGGGCMESLQGGVDNIGIGVGALQLCINGEENVAIGQASQQDNLASFNTSCGFNTLLSNTTGMLNTVLGYDAGNTLTVGSYNTLIGAQAGVTTNTFTNTIAIGYSASASASNSTFIGNTLTTGCYIQGIYGSQIGGTNAVVYADNTGKIGFTGILIDNSPLTSSLKMIENIRDIGDTSEKIYELKPKLFSNTGETDDIYGIIAEDLLEITELKSLILYDRYGEIVGVKINHLVSLLLDQLIKQNRKIKLIKSDVEKLKELVF